MVTYITKQGDTVEAVCYAHYGSTAEEQVERVLEANTTLAGMGVEMPVNTKIILPEFNAQEETVIREVSLWD